MENLLEIMGSEVKTKSITAGTHSSTERQRRVSDSRNCDAETAGVKKSMDK